VNGELNSVHNGALSFALTIHQGCSEEDRREVPVPGVLSSLRIRGLDQIGCFLADHDSRSIRITVDDGRHNRGIGDAQTLHTMDLELGVDHGHWIEAHFARPDRMEDGANMVADIVANIRIALYRRLRLDGFIDKGGECPGLGQPPGEFDTLD